MKKHKFYSPLLAPLISIIIGIYAQQRFLIPIQYPVCALLIISALIVIALLFKKLSFATTLASPLLLCFGSILIHLQTTHHATKFSALEGHQLQLHATITDKGMWGEHNNKHWVRITVHEAFCPNTNTHNHTQFDLLCYFAYRKSICVDDAVVIHNAILKKQTTKKRADTASYQDYLIKEGILCSLFLTGANKCTITSRPSWSIKRWLWQLRHTTYQSMRKKLSKTAFVYVGLMFLGNKEHDSLQQLRTTFNQWGLTHYLARSGLHIVLFIMIWTFILGFIPAHIAIKRLLLILICFVYDLLSWASIPFARALYVFFLVKGGQFMGQQTNFLHLLSLVCLGILIFNPMQLFFLDFQLTFALTFTLVLTAPFIDSTKKHTDIAAKAS